MGLEVNRHIHKALREQSRSSAPETFHVTAEGIRTGALQLPLFPSHERSNRGPIRSVHNIQYTRSFQLSVRTSRAVLESLGLVV